MLSSPRLDPKSHLPEGCTCTSAAVFVPVKPAGKVDTVWLAFSVPAVASKASAVIVLAVSSMR